MTDRRDFLKVMGSAVGCALLAGCGGSGSSGGSGFSGGGGGGNSGGGDSPLPSGFRLTPLLGNGAELAAGLTVVENLVSRGGRMSRSDHPFAWFFEKQESDRLKSPRPGMTRVLGGLPGQAWLTDTGQLGFLALDNKGSRGFYLADIDNEPRISNIRKIVRIGEKLPGGATVLNFNTADVGPNGTAAIRVETGDYGNVVIFLYRGGQLERLLTTYQRLPSLFPKGRTTGRLVGAASVHEGDDLLMAPGLTNAWDMRSMGQALLYIPGARVRDAQMVFHVGEMLPDTTSVSQTISAFQLADDGRYVVAGAAMPPSPAQLKQLKDSEGAQRMTYLMTGSVKETSTFPRLLSAHRSLGVSRRRAAEGSFVAGNLAFNPRIGADGTTAYVVRLENGKQALYVDGRRMITGSPAADEDIAPSGHAVKNVFAPVVGANGHVLCVLGTVNGQELAIFSRDSRAAIVQTGQQIGDKTVAAVTTGLTSRHINRAGRIVFRVDYTDHTTGLVVGDPV